MGLLACVLVIVGTAAVTKIFVPKDLLKVGVIVTGDFVAEVVVAGFVVVFGIVVVVVAVDVDIFMDVLLVS